MVLNYTDQPSQTLYPLKSSNKPTLETRISRRSGSKSAEFEQNLSQDSITESIN